MDYGHTDNLTHESARDFVPADFDTLNYRPEHDRRSLGNRAVSSAATDNTEMAQDVYSETSMSDDEPTLLGQITTTGSAPEVQTSVIAAQDFYPRGEHISRETEEAVGRLIEEFNQKEQPLGDVYDKIIAARAVYQSKIAAKDIE